MLACSKMLKKCLVSDSCRGGCRLPPLVLESLWRGEVVSPPHWGQK